MTKKCSFIKYLSMIYLWYSVAPEDIGQMDFLVKNVQVIPNYMIGFIWDSWLSSQHSCIIHLSINTVDNSNSKSYVLYNQANFTSSLPPIWLHRHAQFTIFGYHIYYIFHRAPPPPPPREKFSLRPIHQYCMFNYRTVFIQI